MNTPGAMSGWRSIGRRIKRWAGVRPPPPRTELLRVPVHLCRHYCGFRYGSDSFNPYENYIVGLHQGIPTAELRRRFEDFICWYRPRNFAETFGITINPAIPLWSYPWSGPVPPNHGWHLGLDAIPDILTHFCAAGVKRSRIEEEYSWLHRAYESIKQHDYQPQAHSYLKVREMTDGQSRAYLVEDGNHRLSALVALGVRDVLVQQLPIDTVALAQLPTWPQVQSGYYLPAEAEQLLRVYLRGMDGFPRSAVPATMIEA